MFCEKYKWKVNVEISGFVGADPEDETKIDEVIIFIYFIFSNHFQPKFIIYLRIKNYCFQWKNIFLDCERYQEQVWD